MGGFVLPRPPVFSPLTPPQIFSRERRLEAIFNKLTMPPTEMPYGSAVPMPPHACQQTALEADGALRLSSRGEVGIMARVLHDEALCPTRG